MVIRGIDTFRNFRFAWERVLEECEYEIDKLFGSWQILTTWYLTQTEPDEVFCLLGGDDRNIVQSGEAAATYGLPLVLKFRLNGRIRLLTTPTDDNCWYAPVAGRAGEQDAREVFSALKNSSEWDVMVLQHIDCSRAFWQTLIQSFRNDGCFVVAYPTMKVGTVVIGDDVGSYYKRLQGNFMRELRRRQRQLEARHGAVTASLTSHGEEANLAFYEGFSMEVQGWKGWAHSAVLQDERTTRYFYQLQRVAAYQGSLALIRVTCGNRLISWLYCLRQGTEAYLFKTAFNEDFRRYGAGQLGTMKAVELLAQQGVRRLNLFGLYVPWHTPWRPVITQYSKVVIARRSVLPWLASVPYRIYATAKRSSFLYGGLRMMRKCHYLAGVVRETLRTAKYLR